MQTSEQLDKFLPAFFEFTRKCPKIKKGRLNKFTKSKYAALDDILDVVKPLLLEHGLIIIWSVGQDGLTTRIQHVSGQYIEDTSRFDIDQRKGISLNQAMGVAITYTQRYSLGPMLALLIGDDTDGALPEVEEKKDESGIVDARGYIPATEKQIALIKKLSHSHVFSDQERKDLYESSEKLSIGDARDKIDDLALLIKDRKTKEKKREEQVSKAKEVIENGLFAEDELNYD